MNRIYLFLFSIIFLIFPLYRSHEAPDAGFWNGKTIEFKVNSDNFDYTLNLSKGDNYIRFRFPSRSSVREAYLSIYPCTDSFPKNIKIFDSDNDVLYIHEGYFGLENRFDNFTSIFGIKSVNFRIKVPICSNFSEFSAYCKFNTPLRLEDTEIYFNYTGNELLEKEILFKIDKNRFIDAELFRKFDKPISDIYYERYLNLTYIGLRDKKNTLYVFADNILVTNWDYEDIIFCDFNVDGVKEIVYILDNETHILEPKNNFYSQTLHINGLLAYHKNRIFVFSSRNLSLYKIEYINANYICTFLKRFYINSIVLKLFAHENHIYLVHADGVFIYDILEDCIKERLLGFFAYDIKPIKIDSEYYIVVGCSDRSLRIYDLDMENLYYIFTVDYPLEFYIPIVGIGDFDLDGYEDIVYAQKAGIKLLKGSGNVNCWFGPYTLFVSIEIVDALEGFFFDDFDYDRDLDIFIGYPSGKLYLLTNQKIISNLKICVEISKFKRIVEKIGSLVNSSYASVPFEFSINSFTGFTLYNLRLVYNTSVSIRFYYPGNILPIKINVENFSRLYLKLKVEYSVCPPQLIKQLPDLVGIEDTPIFIELSNFFWNNDDTNFDVLSSGCNITFYTNNTILYIIPERNYYGKFLLRIVARDSEGFSTSSNFFNITVIGINDAPSIYPIEDLKVRTNTTYYIKIEIYDVDSTNLTVWVSDKTNITVLDNNTLKILYSHEGLYMVNIFVSDGEYVNHTTLNVSVYPYSSPIWVKRIPELVTYKNTAINNASSSINLKDYVEDPDTQFSDLMFKIDSIDYMDFEISSEGYLFVFPKNNYVGVSILNITVSDGFYQDTTVLKIIVRYKNYPPVYLGGLDKEYYVEEDSTWILDLSKHFDDIDSSSRCLIYTASSPAIKISGFYAIWSPRHGDTTLKNLIFYAFDNESEYACSEPINLVYVERNDPPEYLKNMYDFIVEEGCTLIINLSQYFSDEESERLIFGCSCKEIEIEGNVAKYYAERTLRDVVFYAIDPENVSLFASSDPVDIIVLSRNRPPKAFIDHIKIARNIVILSGHGVDSDGWISLYEWKSSVDGILGVNSTCVVKLSPGPHIIYFRVMDNNGTWSEYEIREIYVPYINYSSILFTNGLSLILVGSSMLTLYHISIRRLKI